MVSNTILALGVGTLGAGAVAIESGAFTQGQGSENKKEKKGAGSTDIIPGLAFGRSGGSPPSNYNSPTIVKKTYNTETEGPDIEKNYNIQTKSPGAGGISTDSGGSGGGSDNSGGGSSEGISKKEDTSSGSSGGGSSSINISQVEPENTFSKKEKKNIQESTPQPSDSPEEVTRTLNQNQGYTRTQTTAEMDNPPSLDLGGGSSNNSSKKEEKSSSNNSGGGILDKWASGDWF